MDEVIAAYGILRIKAIRMYVALVNFDAFLVLMLGNLDEPAEVNAITAKVRLNGDTLSLGFPVFQPLGFRHNRRCLSGLLALACVYRANIPAHRGLSWQKH